MFNLRLAGGHLYGKQLFTWLSLVVSLMASFCAVLFPTRCLDEIWDVIESVSERFFTYSWFVGIQTRGNVSFSLNFMLQVLYHRALWHRHSACAACGLYVPQSFLAQAFNLPACRPHAAASWLLIWTTRNSYTN